MQAVHTYNKPVAAGAPRGSASSSDQHLTYLAAGCLLQALLRFVHKVLLFKVQVAFEFDQRLQY